ncbi:MAG: isopenicillin N synthase family oxygenase [Actinobacteria bacterium]|nr:MAG: isopenicillin N synthase family oxygenase [Actinomycetota bacterium]
MDVAVVDYQSPDAPKRFTESLRDTGFAVLTNHPVQYDMVQRLQNEWLNFFRTGNKWDFLPSEGGQDGYRPLEEAERAVGAALPDIKEYFHWYPWGRQPSAESASAAAMYQAGWSLAAELLTWVEANTPSSISKSFSMPLSEMIVGTKRTLLRILHYPPLKGNEPVGSVRAAAHEDINMITVLPAANEPGLQVRDLDGKWHDVPCDPGSVAINAGDMLKYVTAGYYPSTTHQVVNPVGDAATRSRVSTPLFLHPADDVLIAENKTAFDFLRDRIKEIAGVELTKD